MRFQSIVADAPLQLYSSALIFAPEASIIRKNFQNLAPRGIKIVFKGGNRLGCLPQHARGPLGLGQGGGLLTRREAGGVRIERHDGAALGRGDGRAPQHARGPLGRGQRGGLLTRWEAYPNRSRCHYSTFSYHAIAVTLATTTVSHLCRRPVDLCRSAEVTLASS